MNLEFLGAAGEIANFFPFGSFKLFVWIIQTLQTLGNTDNNRRRMKCIIKTCFD